MKSYFQHWFKLSKRIKSNNDVTKMKQQKCLNILNRKLSSQKSHLIQYCLKSLHKNMRMKQISKSFFNKLLETQSGMVMRVIQVWQSLPNKDINKRKKNVLKLFNYLINLSSKDARYVYTQFKNYQLLGESKQKYILNKLVSKCMSY